MEAGRCNKCVDKRAQTARSPMVMLVSDPDGYRCCACDTVTRRPFEHECATDPMLDDLSHFAKADG